MIRLSEFDNRRIAEFETPREVFPPYVQLRRDRDRYRDRRQVNREKDPFLTELVQFEYNDTILLE